MPNINELFPADTDVSKDLLRKNLVGPVVNAQGFGALGDGKTDDRTALANAAAAASGVALFIPPGRYRIGADLSFGRDIGLVFLPGAVLVPDPGVTITVDGVLDAGAYAVFDLSAAGAGLRGTIRASYILPQWFGAVADDQTAARRNHRAFAAAWSAVPTGYGMMLIPPGIYFVDDTVRFSNIVDGHPRNYYGTRIFGSGVISSLEIADFSDKAVVHIEGVEINANALCILSGTAQTARSPAVGLAITRDSNHRGGSLVGTIDVSGAYTHASYYNVSCENCHVQNSTIRNSGSGAVIWDGAEDLPGLKLGRKDSNTRKSFIGCNLLSYGNVPVTLVKTGWVAELSFTNCYFYMDSGHVFSDEVEGADTNGLLIRECRCEVNGNRPAEIVARNRFLYRRSNLNVCEISYIEFASDSDALIEIDGGAVDSLHVVGNKIGAGGPMIGREIRVTNGGRLVNLTGYPRAAIEVLNGHIASAMTLTNISVLGHSDVFSRVEPAIIGDGNYSSNMVRRPETMRAIEWRPGGAVGLLPNTGDTSPPIALGGAKFGDFVRVAAPYDLRGVIATSYVAAPNVIKISVQNLTPSNISFDTGRWVVALIS